MDVIGHIFSKYNIKIQNNSPLYLMSTFLGDIQTIIENIY